MILREKILLGLCGVTALGAGIYYVPDLLESDVKPVSKAATDYTSLFDSVQTSLRRGELTNREERILNTAASQWTSSPIRVLPLPPPPEKPVEEDTSTDEPKIQIPFPQYIGYIRIGTHEVAIIDGVDYRAGDLIQGGEFKLFQILPDRIKVIRRGTASAVDVFLEKPKTNEDLEFEATSPKDFSPVSSDTSTTPEVPGFIPNLNNNSPSNEN